MSFSSQKQNMLSSTPSTLSSSAAATTAKQDKPPSTPSTPSTAVDSQSRRTVILRTLLVGCLLAAIGICVSLSFLRLQQTEEQVGVQNYYSVRDSMLIGAKEITSRKLLGVELWSTMMSNIQPNSTDWPFVVMDGYVPVAQKLAALTSSTTYAMMVLLEPNETEAFESHMMSQYEAQGRPAEAGFSDFGFGIWKRSPDSPHEDGRLHDTTGVTSWDSPRSGELVVALAMHNQPAASSLLLNLYSIQNRGVYIDSMLDCVESHQTNYSTSPECTVTTDMLQLVVRPGPAGLVFQPIFPANDPTNFVGFATTSLHWSEVLENVVPNYVSGLICVISTATKSWTFEIRDGVPVELGEGDLHDSAFDDYARSTVLTENPTGANLSAVYTLTVYPSEEMLGAFNTTAPMAVALGFLGAIVACAIVFFVYDWLMRHENHQRLVILEMKRRFVRFISHEIRTPLNTVCMGLELLQEELKLLTGDATKQNQGSIGDIELWKGVVDDINENAYIAVEILNDLLNYDKLESGTMKMEIDPVLIWDLVEKTCGQFRIQAANAKLELKLQMNPVKSNTTPEDVEAASDSSVEFGVLGDGVRLGQVLRNIISNALKFTMMGGTIKVSANHITNGMPHVARPTLDDGKEAAHPRAGSIEIIISDNGVGMTPDQLAMLFSEGVQFDANRLQHGGGSGLGLSIAKGIVEQHHGTVKVTSDGPGSGTTFRLEFPLYQFGREELMSKEVIPQKAMQVDQTTITEAETETDSISSTFQRSRRVLVAEDALSSRKMLIRLLERAGHEAVPAVNGLSAVEAVTEDLKLANDDPNHKLIDTILMDYEMPLMKGPDAAKEIRSLGYQGILLGVTGNVLTEDVEYFKSKGADDVLGKPVRMDCINEYWQRHTLKNDFSQSSTN